MSRTMWSYTMLYVFTVNILFYQVKMPMFYNCVRQEPKANTNAAYKICDLA